LTGYTRSFAGLDERYCILIREGSEVGATKELDMERRSDNDISIAIL
jgi:hypothetical protein